MFTGIIEEIGTVQSLEVHDKVRRIRIDASIVLQGLKIGASVAIDGACHTAVEVDDGGFSVDTVGTTMSRTISSLYKEGARVNLERAAALGARLDGHLVQGHVDGLGELLRVSEEGDYRLLDFMLPSDVLRKTILHGSVSLNGISLTVNALTEDGCQVAVIPHTWTATNLSELAIGDPVNVEGDLIGKYVARMIPPEG